MHYRLDTTLLPTQEENIELLMLVYKAFNSRDINTATDLMAFNIKWPKPKENKRHVKGSESVCSCWTEEWSDCNTEVKPLSFHFESNGQVLVNVECIHRNFHGETIERAILGHRFTIENSLITQMDICEAKA